MKKKIFLLCLILLSVFIGACSQAEEPKTEEPQAQQAEEINLSEAITEQWSQSAHAKATGADDPASSPGMREGGNCFFCHNGYAFELKAEKIEGIGKLKGTSCDTCHTGYGYELMKTGAVEVALGNIKGGKGSLCIACHSGRGKTPDQKSAPHHSVQADFLLGKSGAEVEGFSYGKAIHANVTNSCLACHMAEDKDGIQDHTFKMNVESVDKACATCHKDFTNFNPAAQADYDGDGNIEGIQDEVTGLLEIVKAAIDEKLAGGKFTTGHGSVIFQDASGKELEKAPSPELYNAAWNYFLVDFDGSKGVHNPDYAVQLLQQSYKQLTGTDVPNATMK